MKISELNNQLTAYFISEPPIKKQKTKQFLMGFGVEEQDYQNFSTNVEQCTNSIFTLVSTKPSSKIISALVQIYPAIDQDQIGWQIGGLLQLKNKRVVQFKNFRSDALGNIDKLDFSALNHALEVLAINSGLHSVWDDGFDIETAVFLEWDKLAAMPRTRTIGNQFNRLLGRNILSNLNLVNIENRIAQWIETKPIVFPWNQQIILQPNGLYMGSRVFSAIDTGRTIFNLSVNQGSTEFTWLADKEFPFPIDRIEPINIIRLVECCIQQEWNEQWAEISKNALQAFIQTLDPMYHRIQRIEPGEDGEPRKVFDWVMKASVREQERRCQFIESFGLLADYCLSNFDSNHRGDLDQAIGEGKELIPLLAEKLNIHPQAIRSLRALGSEQQDIIDLLRRYVPVLREVKELLPTQAYPVGAREWRSFLGVISNIPAFTRGTYRLWTRAEPLLKEENWLWKRKALDRGTVYSIYDFTQEFTIQCLFPQVLDCLEAIGIEPSRKDVYRIVCNPVQGLSLLERVLTTRFTLNQLLEMSKIWHRDQDIIYNGVAVDTERSAWPGLFPAQQVEDIWMQPLCSASELEEEGREMNHCVGVFSSQCMYERTHIISLRDERGRVSTLMLDLVEDENGFLPKAVQHFGKNNSEPSSAAERAVQTLLAGIRAGTIRVDWNSLQAQYIARTGTREKSALIENIGFDPKDDLARNRALKFWKFALPKEYQGLEYQEWVERTEIDNWIKLAIHEDTPQPLMLG